MIIYYSHKYSGQKEDSHKLLWEVISKVTGNEKETHDLASSIYRGKTGKPHIPEFHEFSISHSNHTWGVLLDSDACGLDIQYHRRCDIKGIASRFYAKEDADQILSIESDEEREAAFFRTWARREALIKAAETSVADSEIPSVMDDVVTYQGKDWRICDITISGTDHVSAAICIAVTSKADHLILQSLDA